jgi:hypothetical protein
MDSLMFVFFALASFLSILILQQVWFHVGPAILGLALSMLLQLAGIFQWCIRQSAEVVNLMVSVERVLGFGALSLEAPLEQDGDAALLQDGPLISMSYQFAIARVYLSPWKRPPFVSPAALAWESWVALVLERVHLSSRSFACWRLRTAVLNWTVSISRASDFTLFAHTCL